MRFRYVALYLLFFLFASTIVCRAGSSDKSHGAGAPDQTLASESEVTGMRADDELRAFAKKFTALYSEDSDELGAQFNRDFIEAAVEYCIDFTCDNCDYEDIPDDCFAEDATMTDEEADLYKREILNEWLSPSGKEPFEGDVDCSWRAIFIPCDQAITSSCPELDDDDYEQLSHAFDIANCGVIQYECGFATSENSYTSYPAAIAVGDVGQGIQGLVPHYSLGDEFFEDASPVFSGHFNRKNQMESTSHMPCSAQEFLDVEVHDISYELTAAFLMNSNIEQFKGKTKDEIIQEAKSQKFNWPSIQSHEAATCSLTESYVPCETACEMYSQMLEDVDINSILSEFGFSECWVQTARITNKNQDENALKYIDVELIRAKVSNEWIVISKSTVFPAESLNYRIVPNEE